MDAELVWAAGFFEGKGSTSGPGRAPLLQLKSGDEKSVKRFGSAVKHGRTYGPYGPYPSQIGKSPYWVWVARGWKATAVADLLRPWFSEALLHRLDLQERVDPPRRLRQSMKGEG